VISLYLQFEKMLYHSFLDLLQSVEGDKWKTWAAEVAFCNVPGSDSACRSAIDEASTPLPFGSNATLHSLSLLAVAAVPLVCILQHLCKREQFKTYASKCSQPFGCIKISR